MIFCERIFFVLITGLEDLSFSEDDLEESAIVSLMSVIR